MDSLTFYKAATRFADVKRTLRSGLSEHLQISLHACGCQNGLSKLLQAYYMLCGIQNWLSKPLQAYYTLCGRENGLSQFYKVGTRFADVKTDSLNFYKPTSQNGLSKVLQGCYTLCGCHNGLCELLQAFAVVNYTLCGSENGLSKPLQAYQGKRDQSSIISVS